MSCIRGAFCITRAAMWDALRNVATLVKPWRPLFVAIYNDAGESTRRWTVIKRLYNASLAAARSVALGGGGLLSGVALCEVRVASRPSLQKRPKRCNGMARATDFVDWVGGYPFEFAAAEEIFAFYRQRGFTLDYLKTRGGNACNEFVFTRNADGSPDPWPRVPATSNKASNSQRGVRDRAAESSARS